MTAEQRQEATQKRHKVYLDQRTIKWKREAANRDVSKYPKQPFDRRKHVVDPDTFNPINAAKQFDQRTLNEDGSQKTLAYVVCNELIKGVEPFRWINEEVLWTDDIKDRLGVERYEEHYRLDLKDELIRQYSLPGLEGMSLLPQSKPSTNKKRTCCKDCFKTLTRSRGNSNDDCGPPKNPSPMDLRAGTFLTNLNWKIQMVQRHWSP